MKKKNHADEITNFINEEFGELRTTTINGEPWFVAKDVCNALGISWSGKKILKDLPPQWEGVVKFTTPDNRLN